MSINSMSIITHVSEKINTDLKLKKIIESYL